MQSNLPLFFRTGLVPSDREGALGVREADLRARQREGLVPSDREGALGVREADLRARQLLTFSCYFRGW